MDLSCDYLIDITGLTDVPKETELVKTKTVLPQKTLRKNPATIKRLLPKIRQGLSTITASQSCAR